MEECHAARLVEWCGRCIRYESRRCDGTRWHAFGQGVNPLGYARRASCVGEPLKHTYARTFARGAGLLRMLDRIAQQPPQFGRIGIGPPEAKSPWLRAGHCCRNRGLSRWHQIRRLFVAEVEHRASMRDDHGQLARHGFHDRQPKTLASKWCDEYVAGSIKRGYGIIVERIADELDLGRAFGCGQCR